MMRELQTQRLRLEPLVETHASALFEGLRDEALYQFIGERPPKSIEALRERYRRLSSRMSPDGNQHWLNWALCSLATGHYVGWVQATVRRDRSADIAYVLFRDQWGNGYAREAVAALIDHLREEWGAKRIKATVDTRNLRSITLLETLGFQRGSGRRNAEVIHGVASDEVEYLLLVD